MPTWASSRTWPITAARRASRRAGARMPNAPRWSKTAAQLASESQKKANDALFKGLDQQQDALTADARTLQQLQGKAQGATGQMQAIGYANQLASQQANQLLQIRGLLMAQQNAIATRNQALADREAQEAASSEQLRKGSYKPSPARSW